jgi:hypothetical protein
MKKAATLTLSLTLLLSVLAGALSVKYSFAASEDLTENSWASLSSMPSAGMYEAAVVNGKIYIFGNFVTYEYDPTADTWATKNPKLTSGYFAVAVFQNKVYTFGEATEVYDTATDTW